MEVVRFCHALADACQLAGLAAPEWILEQDVRCDASAAKSPSDRLILHEVFEIEGRRVAFRPDLSFHLRVPDPSSENGRTLSVIGYMEIDRGTEAIRQVLRKLPGMAAFFGEPEPWKRHWPAVVNPVVRIFVVCKSRQRVDHLIKAIRKKPVAPLFRFAVCGDVTPQSLLREPIWRDVGGNGRAFLR